MCIRDRHITPHRLAEGGVHPGRVVAQLHGIEAGNGEEMCIRDSLTGLGQILAVGQADDRTGKEGVACAGGVDEDVYKRQG